MSKRILNKEKAGIGFKSLIFLLFLFSFILSSLYFYSFKVKDVNLKIIQNKKNIQNKSNMESSIKYPSLVYDFDLKFLGKESLVKLKFVEEYLNKKNPLLNSKELSEIIIVESFNRNVDINLVLALIEKESNFILNSKNKLINYFSIRPSNSNTNENLKNTIQDLANSIKTYQTLDNAVINFRFGQNNNNLNKEHIVYLKSLKLLVKKQEIALSKFLGLIQEKDSLDWKFKS